MRNWFRGDRPIFVARAPGRLDVMGGIADYSGSLVLQLPLDRATTVLAQAMAPPRCEVSSRRAGEWHVFSIDLDSVLTGELTDPSRLSERFRRRPEQRWAAYVVGVVQRCLHRTEQAMGAGLRLLIDSTVPEGKGVSSSAALEVATMAATAAWCGREIEAETLARECQWVENHVVGAPCGIMDQMTSACGLRDRLLRLRCQPGTIEGHLEVPPGYRFFGIDSGVRHAVTGADYGTVRTAAFMGYRMIAAAAGLKVSSEEAPLRVEDPRWGGYLANLRPGEFADSYEGALPVEMEGAEFLARFGGITDPVTRVEPGRRYPIRQATAHPIHEQARVTRFAELLGIPGLSDGTAVELGRLMYASHRSYGSCGLGHPGTDRLVELVAELGTGRGLFGAKITGGGSGGTVAVLARDGARAEIEALAQRYREETGQGGEVFADSGPGAAETGVLELALRR